jgi:hypothetical protein
MFLFSLTLFAESTLHLVLRLRGGLTVTIGIRHFSMPHFDIEIDPQDTVESLKVKIGKHIDQKPCNLLLEAKTGVMKDSHFLSAYQLESNPKVAVTIMLLGKYKWKEDSDRNDEEKVPQDNAGA